MQVIHILKPIHKKKGKKEKRKRLAPTFDRQKSLMHGQITNTKKEKNM
jgi:hypothetical protein